MNDQERAKAAVKKVEAKAIPFEGENFYYPYDKNILDLLRPIAAGTHLIVPKPYGYKMHNGEMSLLYKEDQQDDEGLNAIKKRYNTNMIKAAKEGE